MVQVASAAVMAAVTPTRPSPASSTARRRAKARTLSEKASKGEDRRRRAHH
jgi:hypothetical protein